MTEWIRRNVTDEDVGSRLDVFVTAQPEVGYRAWAKTLVQEGHVKVDDEPAKPGQRLDPGQVVAFRPVPLAGVAPRDPGPPPELTVLYEDADLVVIDKPVGLAAHAPDNRRFVGHTIASLAEARFGPLPCHQGEDRPGIVHRLDRDTSGVMVLARHDESFHYVRAQFKARTVQKEYLALCWGEPRFESDWIERNLGPDPRHPERQAVLTEGGREAQTYYEVEERFAGITLFRCKPRSGRTHQIRVHMTSIGHGLVGDRIYKDRRNQHNRLPDAAPDPGRQCLHAARLTLPHPRTHEPMTFEAPLPKDIGRLLAWLRSEAASG